MVTAETLWKKGDKREQKIEISKYPLAGEMWGWTDKRKGVNKGQTIERDRRKDN